jgi:hypothetical protein
MGSHAMWRGAALIGEWRLIQELDNPRYKTTTQNNLTIGKHLFADDRTIYRRTWQNRRQTKAIAIHTCISTSVEEDHWQHWTVCNYETTPMATVDKKELSTKRRAWWRAHEGIVKIISNLSLVHNALGTGVEFSLARRLEPRRDTLDSKN